MVHEYERIGKADAGENLDWILRGLFTFCSIGWRFILWFPSARHMHIAMQMNSEKHYFPLQLNYYSWLMNFFCMKMIWKWCTSCFSLLLGHKLCFYVNSVSGAGIICRYIAFLPARSFLGFVCNTSTSIREQRWGTLVSCGKSVEFNCTLFELINDTGKIYIVGKKFL